MSWRVVVKVVRFSAALLIGLFMMLAVTSQIAVAQSSAAPASQGVTVPKPSSSLTYAWVVTNNVQVYANPGDATPVRDLGAGFLYVSLPDARPIEVGDQKWYQINKGEYVKATDIVIVRPSAFQGITFTVTPDKPFGWMVYSVKPSAKAGDAPAASAALITRYTPIAVFEETTVGDLTWYRIGENQWVDQKKVALIFPTARPEGVAPTDKWVDVNKFEQTLAAYEGDRLVYATLVSSGLPQWDTDSGLFRIFMKVRQAKMSGRDGLPDYYFLEDVPYAMYFNRDMALHGAYWHDKFGFKHSHGCVNLPPSAAAWLWNWTTPDATDKAFVMVADRINNTEGTWVWVH
jgi:lipoprotein-anchoring transpeptidase ErfK/SrfK